MMECRICARSKMTMNKSKIMIKNDVSGMNLEIIEEVAQGGHGRVFRCRDLITGRTVAMKQIPIVMPNQAVPGSIIREVSLLKELHHNNIVSLLKVGHSSDANFINLVFEHLHCDLGRYIQDTRYPIDAATRKTGTCWYKAPEILCNSREYSTPVDLWSVGCIFAEMVIRQPLFLAINSRDELEAIFRLLGTPTEDTWPGITQVMPNLHTYPKFMPLGLETFVTGLEQDGLNLLSMMLCLNPRKRISAEAALKHAYFKGL